MKIVINTSHGRFRVSQAACIKLIEWGIPVRPYVEARRSPETGLWVESTENAGIVVLDHGVEHPYVQTIGRYSANWIAECRNSPLLVRLVEELGGEAGDRYANLKIVEIPDGIAWQIDGKNGVEHVAEQHQTWS